MQYSKHWIKTNLITSVFLIGVTLFVMLLKYSISMRSNLMKFSEVYREYRYLIVDVFAIFFYAMIINGNNVNAPFARISLKK